MVVGSDAAHTPSRLSVRSSMPEATTSGGTHAKHAVSPGITTCTDAPHCSVNLSSSAGYPVASHAGQSPS